LWGGAGRRSANILGSMGFPDALAALQAELDLWSADHREPRVLDAGCGSQMYLRLGQDAWIVGLDIDPARLERNERVHERIVGDLQTYEWPKAAFDLIVCWDVLEHVRDPRRALENLRPALRRGGLLIVGAPNVLSLKGLLTKGTPFWLHRLYYRQISTIDPFRTHLRLWMAPDRIRCWAAQSSLVTRYIAFYESPLQANMRQKLRLDGKAWARATAAARYCSAGKVDLAATDFMLVLQRA
jgi:SAM-dependent methyltransferase